MRRDNGAVKVYIGDYALKPTPEMNRHSPGTMVSGSWRAFARGEHGGLDQPAEDALKVTVLVVEPLGSQDLLTIRIGDDIIKASTHPDFRAIADQDIWIRFPSARFAGSIAIPASRWCRSGQAGIVAMGAPDRRSTRQAASSRWISGWMV